MIGYSSKFSSNEDKDIFYKKKSRAFHQIVTINQLGMYLITNEASEFVHRICLVSVVCTWQAKWPDNL